MKRSDTLWSASAPQRTAALLLRSVRGGNSHTPFTLHPARQRRSLSLDFRLYHYDQPRRDRITPCQDVGTKTLEVFRVEAERQAKGTLYESIRLDGGQRFMIVMCLTDVDQIARLEKAVDLVDDGSTEDWNTLTLADVAMRTVRGVGFGFESLRDEYGRRSAVVLTATDPRSMRIVETIFNLPR